jgi:2-succinyl-5-enolpyruvyl-6-hydroxy-3-cyclohexene-1-carboxylate synthase
VEGRSIIEVRTDRSGLRALHARIREVVAVAVGGVLAR